MNLEQTVRTMVVENVNRQQLDESEVKLAAIQKLKEIQAQLTQINFLDVVNVMKPDNPLKKEVENMEKELADVRQAVEKFVVANQFDAIDEEEPEEPVGDEGEPEEKEEPEEKKNPFEKKDGAKDKEDEDV